MKLDILLADYVQGTPGQKLHSIGLGWTQVSTPLPPHGLLILVEADAKDFADTVTVRAWLTDDGDTQLTDPDEKPIEMQAELSGQVADDPAGVPVLAPVTLNIGGGLKLEPGIYRWKAEIVEHQCTAERPFRVRGSESSIQGTSPG